MYKERLIGKWIGYDMIPGYHMSNCNECAGVIPSSGVALVALAPLSCSETDRTALKINGTTRYRYLGMHIQPLQIDRTDLADDYLLK